MNQRKVKKFIFNSVIILFLGGILFYVLSHTVHIGQLEYTDNAQVYRHIVPVHSRVQGYIKEIRFEEFDTVRRGDTLILIEDAEFKLHLAQAYANLSNAQAGHRASEAGISVTQSNLSVGKAANEEALVNMENAKRDYLRYKTLYEQASVTQQEFEQKKTMYEAAQARYEQTSHQITSTSKLKDEQTKRLDQNTAAIELAEAAVDLAKLNHSYTVIVATTDGVVGRKDIQVGQLVNPGQCLVDIVDSHEVWAVANYRESQMQHVKVGNRVELYADALPGIVLKGTVERISKATGAAFSVIPQDNATGNFVKVEQRVPVRISLKGNDAEVLNQLQGGLNVECKVFYSEEGD